MNNFICKECGKQFDSKKGFHIHLKAHDVTVGDYYVKNFAKRDLYTNDLLQYKNYDQYFDNDFNSLDNYLNWLKTTSPIKAKNYLFKKSLQKFQHKEISVCPPNLYYELSEMPTYNYYKKFWGNLSKFAQDMKSEHWFHKPLPDDFWQKDCQDIKIFIDTREKMPLNFFNSHFNKLDFGDYTAGGELYSKTFVDRKSQDDFRQTFGKDIERFKREMNRCVKFNSYMFVVIESSIEKLEEENKTSKFKSNLGYLWHNVRDLILQYPKNLQFVFAYSRNGAKKIIPKILFYGQDLWNVDVQYHLEFKALGQEKEKLVISR